MATIRSGWRPVIMMTVLAAGWRGSEAAGPVRGGATEKTNALPAFADGPARRKSVLFTNDVYEAWLAPNGYLHAVLKKDGKPDGPAFRLFYATFWGRDSKATYVFKDEPDFFEPESDMPAIQPNDPVRFGFGMDKDAKGSAEIVFGPAWISIAVKFRPTVSGNITTLRPSIYFSNLPGLRTGAIDTNVDVEAVCAGKVVEMMPDPKTTKTLGFAEEAGRPEPCPEWVVRGLWDGWIVRGRVESKSDAFQFWQYGGTIPANGFGFMYGLSKAQSARKAIILFENPAAPTAPGPAVRAPGPPRPGRTR